MYNIFKKSKNKVFLIAGLLFFFVLIAFFIEGYFLQKQLIEIYNKQESVVIKDKNGENIFIKPNQKGYWARYLNEIPPQFKELLIKKEDKLFYYHFGFNPWSISQTALSYLKIGNRKASSTITQQLVKILLGKEFERNLKNKIIELIYALSLETYQTKEDILKMYANSVYFGNQIQGLSEASQLYFNLLPDLLTKGQILQLLTTIHAPTENNPAKLDNEKNAIALADTLKTNNQNLITVSSLTVKENIKKYSHFDDSYFELKPFIENLQENKQITVDKEITARLREIIKRNIDELRLKNVQNGAAVVIKLPENEILALIGSPNPHSLESGYKINMLNEPRPIGSTIKPFVYLKAFEKGLRPYTLIEDREYKYITALGFPLYPKNFDYKYRGEVNLHYALSNSLNVPAVKVLEYVGLENFYNFLEKDFEFKPIQSWENYQLGIALGGLEMSLFDLSRYFTIFPNNGTLKEIKILKEGIPAQEKTISQPQYIQLVNKILQDRKTGIEQFGFKSVLNLFQENYAFKTGTSRNFRDSWIVGFTPDFLVGVWMGNHDASPMDEVSGQIGAGTIWAQIMELLLNSKYNKKTPFDYNLIKEFYKDGNIEYGLANDNYEKILNALKEKSLILNPHDDDTFLLEENTQIILKAREPVEWFVDEKPFKENIFTPQETGYYQIKAKAVEDGSEETVTIWVTQ